MEYTGANMDLKKPEITDEITTAIVAYGDNFQDIDDYVTAHINSIIAHLDSAIVNTAPIPGSKVRDAMINLKSQVDAIVVGGTEVDPRLSQALVDFESTTWTNFKDLQDFWQERIVVLEDEVNTPDTSSITLSELAQLQTVTDSYDGIPDVEIGGTTLNQVVVNGGVDSSVAANATSRLIDINTDGTIEFNSAYDATNKTFDIVSGQDYFLVAKASAGTFLNAVYLYYSDGTNQSVVGTGQSNNPYGIITANKTLKANFKLSEGTFTGTLTKNFIMLIPKNGTPYALYTSDQMNALINEYWEGLKSPESVELLSREKNIFDKTKATLNARINGTTGSIVVDTGNNVFATDFIRVKSGETYCRSHKQNNLIDYYAFYKMDKTLLNAVGNPSAYTNIITAPQGAYYVRMASMISNIDTFQLNEGSIALPFEDYNSSTISITCNDNTKFDLAKLPNLVQNDIKIVDGKRLANKRVDRNVLESADIVSELLTLTNLDVYYTSAFTGNSIWTTGVDDKVVVTKFAKEVDSGFADVSSNAYSFYASPTSVLGLIVPKGTYANLAAAQAGLAGTVVYYQLATPLLIEEVDLPQYRISIEGSLASNSDHTEFVVNDYGLFAPVTIDYPANISESVNGLKESASGLRIAVDSKADKEQSPIIRPVMLNSWVNFGEAFRNIGYYVNSVNELVFQGMIKNGVTTPGTVIFTLDPDIVDFTAIVGMNTPILTNGVFGYIDIISTGEVRCRDVNTAYISFEGKSVSLNKN